MKTLFAVPLAVALLGGMMLTGGCVPQSKYDEALAAARRANDQLNGVMDAMEKLKADKLALEGKLGETQRALDAASTKNGILETAYARLQGDFDKLKAAYDALAKGGDKVPDISPEVSDAIEKLAKDNGWEYDKERGVARLPSDMTFEKGSDVVLPEPKAALGKFAKIMNSAAASGLYVYVAGHTDDLPIRSGATMRRHPNNWYLSVHRAVSVEEVLATNGLAQNRIGAMGYGENYPIAPNAAGHKGNAANRRVELWIVPAAKFLVLPMNFKETSVEKTATHEMRKHGTSLKKDASKTAPPVEGAESPAGTTTPPETTESGGE